MAVRRVQDALELSVHDDGPAIEPHATFEEGHGLANTRERLRALYGDRASLDVAPSPQDGTIATLRVPFRELKSESDHAAG